MTDRELLELAAKAAGLSFSLEDQCSDYGRDDWGERVPHANGEPWNPLTDDGDALRLAVKLKMRVNIDDDWTGAGWESHKTAPTTDGKGPWGWKEWHYPMSGPHAGRTRDPLAATRRAIVRAAAEIGRDKAG